MDDWKSLAARRHSWSVMAGAAAVLALPMVYEAPQMIHYAAAVILVSGTVSALIEAGRWVWNRLSS
jgi:hypothetical protein